MMTPGFNFTTVGTVRDGAKWPARDRRQGAVKRDRITFDVFSPLTVGRMLAGSARMKQLQESTDRSVDKVYIGGAEVKRVLLRTGQKFYRSAIESYLLEKVVARAERTIDGSASSPADAMAAAPDAVFSQHWVDIGGQMMPRERLDRLAAAVESGHVADLDQLNAALNEILAAYAEDEWAWVRWACGQALGVDLDQVTAEKLAEMADSLLQVRNKFINLVLNDAGKEFDAVIRTGFGQDGTTEDASADFQAVRGDFDTNKFVRQMKEDLANLSERVERLKQSLTTTTA